MMSLTTRWIRYAGESNLLRPAASAAPRPTTHDVGCFTALSHMAAGLLAWRQLPDLVDGPLRIAFPPLPAVVTWPSMLEAIGSAALTRRFRPEIRSHVATDVDPSDDFTPFEDGE